MPKRRIFIAINLPENLKKGIVAFQEKWARLPGRWIKARNLHLTLIPPFYLTDDEIARLTAALIPALAKFAPFQIEFERFIYGPPEKPSRMIWLLGRANERLVELMQVIEDAILNAGIPFRAQEQRRPFRPHITIARMEMKEWHSFEPKPKIDEVFAAVVTIQSVEVMESELKRGGAEYSVLESIPLGHE